MGFTSHQTQQLFVEAQAAGRAYQASADNDTKTVVGKYVKIGRSFSKIIKTEESKLGNQTRLKLVGITVSEHDGLYDSLRIQFGDINMFVDVVEISQKEFDAAFIRVVSKLKDIAQVQGE